MSGEPWSPIDERGQSYLADQENKRCAKLREQEAIRTKKGEQLLTAALEKARELLDSRCDECAICQRQANDVARALLTAEKEGYTTLLREHKRMWVPGEDWRFSGNKGWVCNGVVPEKENRGDRRMPEKLKKVIAKLFEVRKWRCRFCGEEYPIAIFYGDVHLSECDGLRQWQEKINA